MLPPLEPKEIWAAARTFQGKTSARDGMHPRSLAFVSNDAAKALSSILQAVEYYGNFPPLLRQVLVRLIPKPGTADTRPIGLFRGIYRVWCKDRCAIIKSWVADRPQDSEVVNMLPGRQTLDAVWRAQITAEGDVSQECFALEILWDIAKCYENVEHATLQQQATLQGYPLQILRISLASYRWRRLLLCEYDTTSEAIFPVKGIVAGSAHATYEIALLVQQALAGAKQELPECGRSIDVDDLSISVTRRNLDTLIADTTQVALKIKDVLQEELGLPIAGAKSQVIASSVRVEKLWTAATGSNFGVMVTTARRLGVDHALRKVKYRPVLVKRKKGYLKRKILVDKLRCKGGKAQVKVYRAGLMPGLYFGAEVSTPDLTIINKTRKHCIAVHGLRQAGVPYQLSLLALPPALDPKEQVLEKALIRWHREVWYSINPHPNHRDALSMGALQMALGAAQRDAPSQEWENPGPASAALRAARSVGWTCISAIRLLDETGENLDLQGGSPAMLKAKFRKRWPQVQVKEALAHRLQHHQADVHSQQLLDKGWELGPLTKALQSRGKYALRPRDNKQLLLCVAGTGDKLISGNCIKCNLPDSINQRLADCESGEAEDHREELLDPETNKFAGAFDKFCNFLAEQTNLLARHRTWMPPKPIHRRPTGKLEAHYWPDMDDFKFMAGEPIYTDGSCLFPTEDSAAVAGCSLVQMDEDGDVVRSVQVTLPNDMPATAAMAEHTAANMAGRFTTGEYTIVTDCMS